MYQASNEYNFHIIKQGRFRFFLERLFVNTRISAIGGEASGSSVSYASRGAGFQEKQRSEMGYGREMEESVMRTAAKLMVECLVTEGVKYIFGIPGEENLELIQAIADEPRLHFVVVRHEQGAAFMADVYGRLTGKAGVCLATLGPGATNLVTGVADANLDGAPLVAITGQVSSDQMHLTSHQNLDLAKIFEPITKRTKLVMRPDTVNEIVRLAFKYAEGGAGRMGAAHIDLPVDIAKMPWTCMKRECRNE